MANCYDECEEYAVTPVLIARGGEKCCASEPLCYPCLPRCPKGQVLYCCDKKQSQTPSRKNFCEDSREDCCDEQPKRSSKNRNTRQSQSQICYPAPVYCCPTCQTPTCTPVKTKYVIPCYRYEDGRIVNPIPSSALKRNGLQDQKFVESGGISYIRKSWQNSIWSDYPFILPVKPMKKLSAILRKK